MDSQQQSSGRSKYFCDLDELLQELRSLAQGVHLQQARSDHRRDVVEELRQILCML